MHKLRSGDLVEVKSPDEILATLDADGTLDQLPFMPEMLEFCGKRFQVSNIVVKTCSFGAKASSMRSFRNDDVVLLDNLRCSGADHGGCQKSCVIFWRQDWLRKLNDPTVPPRANAGNEQLRSRLKTSTDSQTYSCQASELLKATVQLSRSDRLTKCISEIRAGNCSTWEMTGRVATWLIWRIRRLFLGAYARGTNESTPVESLNLQAGELVEIKAVGDIAKTLDDTAKNRGLWFSPDMRLFCGRSRRVEKKVSKIIMDGTGEMRQLRNTVFLEGTHCGCSYLAFGGCSRREFVYWREIWLRRSEDSR